MSVVQANEIMKEVCEEARKIRCEGLIDKCLIRKALPKRKRSVKTNAPSDSKKAIMHALQSALAKRVMRKKTLLHRLVKGLQSSHLRFCVPEEKAPVTGSRRDARRRNVYLGEPAYGTFQRDWVALKMAIRVLAELDRECAPMRLKYNIAWIVEKMRPKNDYVEMIYAPAKAYVNAIEIASRLLGYSTAVERDEEVDQDSEALPRKASYYLPTSEAGKLAVQNAAIKKLLQSSGLLHKEVCSAGESSFE
jgi:hypothetical protein